MIAYAKAFFQQLRLGLGLIAPKEKDESAPRALTDEELHLLSSWMSVRTGVQERRAKAHILQGLLSP